MHIKGGGAGQGGGGGSFDNEIYTVELEANIQQIWIIIRGSLAPEKNLHFRGSDRAF